MRTLGEVLPELQRDWIRPALTVTVQVAVAVSETAMISAGLNTWLHDGRAYAPAFAIAVLQVVASDSWGRRLAHNSSRKVRLTASGKERSDSEPYQPVTVPAVISMLSGTTSGLLASLFFGEHGWIGWVAAFASPLAAISASLLLGNEAGVAAKQQQWQLSYARRRSTASTAKLASEADSSSLASTELASAGSNGKHRASLASIELACPICGATRDGHGKPFTPQSLGGHTRWCKISAAEISGDGK